MIEPSTLAQRLQKLRDEYDKGQKMLADLERQRSELQSQLLRISGAIQVLEELMEAQPGQMDAGSEPAHPN